jgi:hypothetical protein
MTHEYSEKPEEHDEGGDGSGALVKALAARVRRRIAEEIVEDDDFWEIVEEMIAAAIYKANEGQEEPLVFLHEEGTIVRFSVAGGWYYLPVGIADAEADLDDHVYDIQQIPEVCEDRALRLQDHAKRLLEMAEDLNARAKEVSGEIVAANARQPPDFAAMQANVRAAHPGVDIWVRKKGWDPFLNAAKITAQASIAEGPSIFRHMTFAPEAHEQVTAELIRWVGVMAADTC